MEKEVDNKLAFLVNNNPLNLQTSVFRNKTFMGLLTNYFSFTSFSYKMGLVRTLVDRVYKINNSWLGFHKDIKDLTLILRKNLFPVHIAEKVIKRYSVEVQSAHQLALRFSKPFQLNILSYPK